MSMEVYSWGKSPLLMGDFPLTQLITRGNSNVWIQIEKLGDPPLNPLLSHHVHHLLSTVARMGKLMNNKCFGYRRNKTHQTPETVFYILNRYIRVMGL